MIDRRFIKAFILVLGTVFICSSAVSESEKKELKRLLAETYLASGRNEDAIKAFREVLSRDAFDVEARISLADLLSWSGDLAGSLAEFQRVIELEPGNAEVLAKMARVYYWKGDLENAEIKFRAALGIDPGKKETRIGLAEVLVWMKKYPEAIDILSKEMEDGVAGPEKALYGRALLYSGRYDTAAGIFRQILEQAPSDLEARALLAESYAYSGDYKKAASLYREILGEKEDLKVKEKLADVLSWDRQYEISAELYGEILDAGYNVRVHLQKARVLGWARRYREAVLEYEKILGLDHDDLIELEMNAKISNWNGRTKAAISRYTELIERDPGNVEAMFDLAQIYSHRSMWKDAIREYENILEKYPSHFRARKGHERATLLSEHVSLEAAYRFFEADSPGRQTDIRHHRFLSKVSVPLTYRASMDISHALGYMTFGDFRDIIENEGKMRFNYSANPDWRIGGYYGLVAYNRDMDELFHLFGGDLGFRIMDIGTYSFSYDRERLHNNSGVIRGYYHRHVFNNRVDLDLTRKLRIGADHIYARYSDGNFLNEPGFDLTYKFSSDPRRLSLRYRYFYKEFNEKVGDYFSPKGFSTNLFSLNWRHYLNREEIFFGAEDIYYDLEYTVSIDSTDIAGHKFGWSVHRDFGKRFNFNIGGSFMGSSAGVYDETEIRTGIKVYF